MISSIFNSGLIGGIDSVLSVGHFDNTFLADLVWRPYFSEFAILVLAVVAFCLAIFAYTRAFKNRPWASTGLVSVRLLLIAALTAILMGPSNVIETETKTGRGRFYVIADVSESMLVSDVDSSTRFFKMKQNWLSDSFMSRVQDDFRVSSYTFADQARAADSRQLTEISIATGESTNLVYSIGNILDQLPRGNENDCILLLSDGIDSGDTTATTLGLKAAAKQIPIHTVAFGANTSIQDAALVALPMQEFLFPNETGTILAKIYQVGCSNKQTTLLVKQGDNVQRFPVRFENQDVVEIEIPIQHDSSGQFQYEITLEQVDQEIELRNNLQNVFALVQPQRMQVLILEGQPFWDTKFIAQSLRKDERIELTQVSQITSAKRETIVTRKDEASSSSVPETREEWSKFDVVILGKKIENLLSVESAKSLVEHLQNTGGNLVFARGQACDVKTPAGYEISNILSEIEPVVWGESIFGPSKLGVTMSGKMTQWFLPTNMGLDVESALQRLPGFETSQEIVSVNANARVLAELDNDEIAGSKKAPALLTSSTGAGSIVTITGQGMWRWSLLSTERKDLVGFYDAFWSNMIRWLVVGGDFQPGQQIAMNLNQTAIKVGDEMVVDIVMKHPSPTGRDPSLLVKLPNGILQSIGIQPLAGRNPRFRANIPISIEGVHELLLSSPGLNPDSLSRKFNAYSLNVERLNTAAQPVTLRMISDQSGGRHYDSSECNKFLNELKLAKESMRVPPRTEYIWDQAWMMAVVLIIAGIEWICRRVAGMI